MVRTSGTSPVCLVHLISLIQPNKPDRPNRPNEQDRLADFFSTPLVDLGKIYVKARLSSVRRKNRDDGFGVQVKVSIVE